MTKQEKEMAQRIAEAVNLLSEPERRYIIGYAEGVIAANRERQNGQEEKAG